MNEVQIFSNPAFGQVRTVDVDGKIFFVASDVAKALGYKNPSKAIGDHCKGVTKRYTLTSGGKQAMNVIPEGDVYRLVVHSKLPSAEKFERWVFDEVLPTIRKTGAYAVKQLSPEEEMARGLLAAQKMIAEKDARIKELTPKGIFADAVSASETSILVGDLAKLIKQNGVDMGQKRLFAWMRANGYLIKQKGHSYNLPTQRSMNAGWFEIKETTINNPDGSIRVTKTTKVTGKGQVYFVNLFLKMKATDEVKEGA